VHVCVSLSLSLSHTHSLTLTLTLNRRVGTGGGGASGGSDSEGGIGGVNSADERPLAKGAGIPSSGVSNKADVVGRPVGPTIEARVRTGHNNSVGVPPRTAAGARVKIVSTPAGGTRQATNAQKVRLAF
jgi:hypothetical protein